jgi:hypothetical protein
MTAIAAMSLVAHDGPWRAIGGEARASEVEPTSVAPAETLKPPSSIPATPDPPSFDELPWTTGPDVGMGIALKDAGEARGDNVFIGYAGYQVSQSDAETWVTALYDAWLKDRGVRWVWAVRGPDDSHYEHRELGNTKIAAKLREVAPAASFILVAAHSSGSCVAHELFKHLGAGRDPDGVTAGKIVYFNLDGIEKGLTPSSVSRLRRAYFVGAVDPSTGTVSPNDRDMRRLADTYVNAGGYVEHLAAGAGCADDASWCLHVSLVTKRPHDPRAARAHLDYTDFADRGVETAFFDTKADEAGLAR